ncbi:MAG: biotin carboxylase N-terminal domain-containing protein [bacterium]
MKRIGIVNRGEPAVRFLDALTELRHERPGAPEAVALHVAADARSLYVRRAPHAVCIGEGRAAFLDAANVLAALRGASCDAAWLGWGFASEDAGFAATLEAAGITLLAPRSETMAALGDKIRAKQVAEQHGVPVAPWAIVEDAAQARIEADRIGYPLLVKAAGGGGGRGIRPVDGPEQLAGALVSAREEALRSFGSGALLLERLVTGARHVEVQVLGDGEGRVITLGVRDCSLQRRRQKVIEECPSPALPPAVARHLEEAAARLCGALRYRSAGTVEFLYAPAEGLSCFLEVNTRLQVEHPITEAVHGVDLVRAQILLALGEPLPEVPAPRGHAVEARVTAEDARSGFTPAPGRLERVVWPVGPGIRVDAGFAEGEVLSPTSIRWWRRSSPTARPGRWPSAASPGRWIRPRSWSRGGRPTSTSRSLLDHPAVQAGTADTGLLDRPARAPRRRRPPASWRPSIASSPRAIARVRRRPPPRRRRAGARRVPDGRALLSAGRRRRRPDGPLLARGADGRSARAGWAGPPHRAGAWRPELCGGRGRPPRPGQRPGGGGGAVHGHRAGPARRGGSRRRRWRDGGGARVDEDGGPRRRARRRPRGRRPRPPRRPGAAGPAPRAAGAGGRGGRPRHRALPALEPRAPAPRARRHPLDHGRHRLGHRARSVRVGPPAPRWARLSQIAQYIRGHRRAVRRSLAK